MTEFDKDQRSQAEVSIRRMVKKINEMPEQNIPASDQQMQFIVTGAKEGLNEREILDRLIEEFPDQVKGFEGIDRMNNHNQWVNK